MQEKQGLATGSCGWLATTSRQREHTCQACQKLKRHASCSTTGQNRTIGRSVTSRLELATQSSCEAKLRASPVLKNQTLHIPFSPQDKYPFYPQKKESFQREFWERNPKEKQDWLIHNLYLRDSSNSSTLFLSIVKSLRGLLSKPYLTISISVRELFGVWEVVRKGPIHIGWCYGEVAESGKLKKK